MNLLRNPKVLKNERIIYLILLLFLCPMNSKASSELDSLQSDFDSAINPQSKYEAQTAIAYYYYKLDSLEIALNKYKLAVQMVPKNDLETKGDAIKRVARVYHEIEDLSNALKYYKLAYGAYQKAKSEPAVIADVLKEIGREFYGCAQYDSAMVYYMKSKDIYEQNKIVNEDYGNLLHFIGSVFKRQGNYEKACEYYNQEIELGKKHQFERVYAEGFYLAVVCYETDRERVNHNLQALQLYEALEDESMIGLMYGNIAGNYKNLGLLDSAYYYYEKSIALYRKSNRKSHLANTLASMADVLIAMGRYYDAIEFLAEAEALALQSELKRHLRLANIYEGMYKVNHLLGNYEAAIEFLHLAYAYQDSARDSDHLNAIHEMELSYETEKKEAEIAVLQANSELEKKEKLLAEEEAAQQAFMSNMFMWGGLLVLGLGVLTFIKLRESQKQKQIILKQKKEVEFQRDLVDEKNKDIMDSMVYASTIQQAIITSEDYIKDMFRDFFVLYKPRDIVSGDFYWAYQNPQGQKLIAVGDCTGHGVPGAMMSMLGTAFLNEIVVEGKEMNPAKVLEKLRIHVKDALKNKGAKDGMDMSFCMIDDRKLTFAGANLPIYIVRNNELIEIKGNKQPVGFHAAEEIPFEAREFELENEDHLYLFSDGYADQFGGPKGKKYKYKTLRDKLSEICNLSMKDQKKIIDEDFETWKGDLEQLDDVCILGIRV